MSNSEPVSSLKGIGEKPENYLKSWGSSTIDDLLSYYPRAYDTYEPPVPVGQLKEQMDHERGSRPSKAAGPSAYRKDPDVSAMFVI